MLRILFILMILIPGLVAALASRYWALLLYIWNALFRPQDFLWISTSRDLRLSLILGLLLVVPSLLTGVLPNVTHPLSLGAIAFLGSGLLAQTNAIDPVVGWNWVDAHARLTIVCLLATTLARTPRHLMGILAVMAGSIGFYSTKAGIASMLGGGVRYGEGIDGTFVDNNGFALATGMIIPFFVALGQNAYLAFGGLVTAHLIRWIRLGLYIAVPLCIYTVVSTFSRGGFLGLAAIALAYALFHPRRVRMVAALALLAALMLVIPLPEGYLDRISSIKEFQEDSVNNPQEDVTEGRFYLWGLAIEMVKDKPLGIGMRNFHALFGSYDELHGTYGNRRDVHSSHFQVLVEHGYLGAATWIFLFAYSSFVGLRVRRRSRTPGLSVEHRTFLETVPTAMVVSMAGFVIGGSTISAALNELTWLTFALMAAIDRLSKQLCASAQPAAPQSSAVTLRPTMRAVARTPVGVASRGAGIQLYRR